MIDLRLRRPEPDDYPRVVRVLDDWCGTPRAHVLLPRLWFEHFSSTSTLAYAADGSLAGFVVGFASPDRPHEGVIVVAGTNPNIRRRGVGRRLHEAFVDDMRPRGVTRILESVWPANRGEVEFLEAMGFRPDQSGGQRLYGVAAFRDHEWAREDRAVFVLDL